MLKTIELSDDQIALLVKHCQNEVFALHNHIASAIENPAHWNGAHSAAELVKKLREQEAMLAVLRKARRGEE